MGWLLWQRMETTVPTLCDYPGTAVTLCCLCKTSSAPCLAPALNLGQGVQGRNGPISCRAGFLHSSLLQHNFTMSVLELVGACVDTWKSLSVVSAGEGSKLWADVQSPPFLQGAGSVSHPCPRKELLLGWLHPSSPGTTLFLCPSCFPDRGHCSQHSLMGAAAPNPPALP